MNRSSPCGALLAACLVGTPARAQLPDYQPATVLTVLDTDFAVLQTTAGPVTVRDGVFRFRNVSIPAGFVVRGVGSRPMIWLVDTMTVDGVLSVSGSDGTMVNTLNSANMPVPGGRGGAAGGDGGSGSPQVALRSFAGMPGFGPGNSPAVGGGGGQAVIQAVQPLASFGAGGGGGAFATAGDPYYPVRWLAGTSFVQQLGIGGFGGTDTLSGSPGRSLTGGGPGGAPFADGDDENDFFGPGYDVFRQREVPGELTVLVGGAGGGGGGDLGHPPGFLPLGFAADAKGGGGGGGGGCLVVAAANRILVSVTGSITANGGDGGGGEQAGSCNEGGGGGGGSGGLLILAAGTDIVLDVHGETYANLDYDFALSADGGVCRTGSFLPPTVGGKYAHNGQLPLAGDQYDRRALGGFGGMGVVELVVPAGNNSDGTNTALDDNIRLQQNGVALVGAQKQRFLAWRGWYDQSGQRVDDLGQPVVIGAGEGDIRPSPVLIPLR